MNARSVLLFKKIKPGKPGARPGWTLPKQDFLLFLPTPFGRRQKYFVVAEPQKQDFGVASKGQAGTVAFVTLSSYACH